MEITQSVILSLVKFLEDNNDYLEAKSINRRTSEEKELPAVIIREGTSSFKNIEIGSKQFWREITVYFEVFGKNDKERLDLKDKLIHLLRKNDIPLYDISSGDGEYIFGNIINYMTIVDMSDYKINLGEDLANLNLIDRYRHLITVTFNVGRIE